MSSVYENMNTKGWRHDVTDTQVLKALEILRNVNKTILQITYEVITKDKVVICLFSFHQPIVIPPSRRIFATKSLKIKPEDKGFISYMITLIYMYTESKMFSQSIYIGYPIDIIQWSV